MSSRWRGPAAADLATYLAPLLQPGEDLLWCGQPRQLMASKAHAFALPFYCGYLGLLLSGIAVDQLNPPDDWYWWALGASSVGLGVILWGLYLGWLSLYRGWTVYAVTATNAIIHTGFPVRRTVFVRLPADGITLELGARDCGTINFGSRRGWPFPPEERAFLYVRHARQVYELACGRAPRQAPLPAAAGEVLSALSLGDQSSASSLLIDNPRGAVS